MKVPPAKRSKSSSKKANSEETDGALLSKTSKGKDKVEKKAVASGNKKLTDWTSVNWNELGQTKDSRCLLICDIPAAFLGPTNQIISFSATPTCVYVSPLVTPLTISSLFPPITPHDNILTLVYLILEF